MKDVVLGRRQPRARTFSRIMMLCVSILSLVYAQLSLADSTQKSVIKIPSARSVYDISYDYYTKLLRLALKKGAPEDQPIPEFEIAGSMPQGRAVLELIKGENLDVFWIGTDQYKESQLNAVKIPLERGLMGFRKFIIHKDSTELFNKISTVEQLQELVACQGTHWPDTKILKASNLKVLSSPVYETLFLQIDRKRCDYFPRGYHEGGAEIEQRKKILPDLVRFNDIILHYPFTVYFFTSKQNKNLAEWIERGLLRAIEDGSFIAHMRTHPLTAHVFPVEKWMNVKHYFHLHNPELSLDTDYTNAKFWFQPKTPHRPHVR